MPGPTHTKKKKEKEKQEEEEKTFVMMLMAHFKIRLSACLSLIMTIYLRFSFLLYR